jgi:hypothetical protein
VLVHRTVHGESFLEEIHDSFCSFAGIANHKMLTWVTGITIGAFVWSTTDSFCNPGIFNHFDIDWFGPDGPVVISSIVVDLVNIQSTVTVVDNIIKPFEFLFLSTNKLSIILYEGFPVNALLFEQTIDVGEEGTSLRFKSALVTVPNVP